jgi:molybdenum cofactor cytidylyltransferase
MKLVDAIKPQSHTRLAIVGAGGKTTVLFRLAKQITGPVIITASTHLGFDQVEQVDHHYAVRRRNDLSPLRKKIEDGVTLVTGVEGTRKGTDGLSFGLLEELNAIAYSHDVPFLIVADSSRGKPLKAPAKHEPLIPDFVDSVVVLAGLSGLDKPLNPDWVYRPERFEHLSGLKIGDTITLQAIVNVLIDECGGLKNIPKGARRIAFLNQVDTHQQAGMAKGIVKFLQKAYEVVFVGSMLDNGNEVEAAFVRVAGVILAAGGSIRMGTSKQLLQWEGQPLVRVAAEKALKAGLDPVLVVTGAFSQEVQQAVEGLEVQIVQNPDWEKGQSTSVKTGITSLPDSARAVIFFVVDQPKLPIGLVDALIDTHARTLAPIVVPMIDHKHRNPVLFDKITYKDLSKIKGDMGGRQIFSRFPLTLVPWLDSSVLADVDTMEDYEKLIE